MPSVDIAMARSLRGGVWGAISGSLRTTLTKRNTIENIQDHANEAKWAFSSWDNCMQVTYCKWSVIAMIVIAGLIVLSIIWCIARCACCGVSCCCKCCYCLKCCGNCLGMCDTPKGRPHKHLDDSYMLPHQGYRTVPPMKAPFAQTPTLPTARTAPSAHLSDPPQYAEFDVSKRSGGDDSLPAMPSWESSGSKKVLLEDGSVEMDQLKKPETAGGVPLMAGGVSSQSSPAVTPDMRSPYGQSAIPGPNGYEATAQSDPYGGISPGHSHNAGVYGQSSSSLAAGQYGVVGGMAAMGPGHRSPGHGYNGATPNYAGQDYDGYDQHSHVAAGGRYSPPRGGAYGNEPMRRSPVPPADFAYNQRQYSSNDNFHQAYPPQRQYSSDSTRPLASRSASDRYYTNDGSTSPNLQNNGGFDFNSGYSRPQQHNYNPGPSVPRQPQSSGPAYPGQRPYKQPQDGWSGL